MPRFLVTCTFPALTPEQLDAVGKNVKSVCSAIPLGLEVGPGSFQ